mgnify:CR=1 FL=1|jgi:hypothetical protein
MSMKAAVRTITAMALAASVGVAPAFAQQVPETTPLAPPVRSLATQAAEAGAQLGVQQFPGSGSPSGRALMWTGTGLFVGGMGVAIYGFLNNKNGKYPEFGEFTATSTSLGAAGIVSAFAGGALMALGHKVSRTAPDIQVGVGQLEVSKKLSW